MNIAVFTQPDTDIVTDQNGLYRIVWSVHTAQRQTPTQIAMGFCTHFISICILSGALMSVSVLYEHLYTILYKSFLIILCIGFDVDAVCMHHRTQ